MAEAESREVQSVSAGTNEEAQEIGRGPQLFGGGTVYAITAGGFVKIGHTSGSVSERKSNLQTGSPLELKLVATMPGSLRSERVIHDRLSKYRMRGEWFRLEGDALDLVNAMIEDARSPFPGVQLVAVDLVAEWAWSDITPDKVKSHHEACAEERMSLASVIWDQIKGRESCGSV